MPVESGAVMNVVAFLTAAEGKFVDWGNDVKRSFGVMEQPNLWTLFDHGPIPSFGRETPACWVMRPTLARPTKVQGLVWLSKTHMCCRACLATSVKQRSSRSPWGAYDHIRRPRDMKLVETSRACGEVYEFFGPETGDDVQKIDENLSRRYEWIWEEDITGRFTRALEIFEMLKTESATKADTSVAAAP